MAKNFESSTSSNSSKIINPLLSTSNTITLDDFSNKLLLLPAAPPIVAPKLVEEEPKELVTVGQSQDNDDTLSEINLNINQDEDQLNLNTINLTNDPFPQIQHEPLQHYPIENSDDSIISQAASSFSQLPSVASTVLSTFSKVIHNYTPGSREISSERDLNFNQPQSEQHNITNLSNLAPDNNYNQNKPVDVKPPTFFKTTEFENKTPTTILPPPLTAVSNTYRLTTKKKTYAQIPGLSTHIDGHILTNNPDSLPSIPSPSVSAPFNQTFFGETNISNQELVQHNQPPLVQEEKKLSLFSSLSNIVPPVLQNLSGIVKSVSPSPAQPQIDHTTNIYNKQDFVTLSNPIDFNQDFSNTNKNNSINYEPYQTVPSYQALPTPTELPSAAPPITIPVSKSGTSSFRLQKGTKLYKSPFDSNSVVSIQQETQHPIQFGQIPSKIDTSSTSTLPIQNIFVPPAIDTNLPTSQFDQNSNFSHIFNPQILPTIEHNNPSNQSIQTPLTIDFSTSQITSTNNTSGLIESPNLSNYLPSEHNLQFQSFNPLILNQFVPAIERSTQLLQNTEENNNFNNQKPIYQETPLFFNPQELQTDISKETKNFKVYDKTIQSKSVNPIKTQFEQDIFSTPPPPPPVAVGTSNIPTVYKAAPNYPPPPIEEEVLKGLEKDNKVISTALPPRKDSLSLSANRQSNPFRRGSASSTKTNKVVNPANQISSLFNPVLPSPDLSSKFFNTELESTITSVSEFGQSESIQLATNLPQNIQGIPELLNISKDQNIPQNIGVVPVIPISTVNFGTNQFENIAEPSKPNLTNYFATQVNLNFNEQSADLNKNINQDTDIQKFSNNILDNNLNNIEKYSPEKLNDSPKEDNTFSNFFTCPENQTPQKVNQNKPDLIVTKVETTFTNPSSFFDTFTNSQQLDNTVEDPNSQRIQNFFNNPPQQDNNISCLDYNLKRNIIQSKPVNQLVLPENRSNSPQSNIVEPPASSACSEFSSELNSTIGLSQQTDQEKLPSNNLANKNYLDVVPDELLEELKKMATNDIYVTVVKHWFFKQSIDTKSIWMPFSHRDSNNLEENFINNGSNIVQVEGGRHDVNIIERTKTPVYWNGKSCEVKRCSWFYKAIDSKYVPYDENVAELLENEYKKASDTGEWHQKILLENGDTVVFHGPTVIVHFFQSQTFDAWGGSTQSTTRPRVVKRDLDDFVIEAGETDKVDHLLFMIHGIGSACDLKFRPVEEVVEDFRSIAYQLVQSHYKNSCDSGDVGRIEVLPISWHAELHAESGIDEKLKAITLESIPKLRNFANDTVLDVLFYTSPVFCQSIINTVANSLNDTYTKFCHRNHDFSGQVSLAGHSLGSLILFDLLCHQKPIEDNDQPNSENPDQLLYPLSMKPVPSPTTSKQITYTVGQAGTGQPYISYPQLLFAPKKFFALGSPIGMFVTIRGLDSLGLDFEFPTCSGFYNIFHPYDPVAYRIESLINPELKCLRPVLIPHHKGRKRMHLELKETVSRVGAEVKQRILDTFKSTMDSVFFLSPKNKITEAQELEKEVDKVLEMQLKIDQPTQVTTVRSRTNSTSTCNSDNDPCDVNLQLGKLNNSKRIDYVLQEAPLEFFNEYLFALTSHVCYWDSEDTILFVIKEIYSSLGIKTDSQIPQQTMTIERPASDNNLACTS